MTTIPDWVSPQGTEFLSTIPDEMVGAIISALEEIRDPARQTNMRKIKRVINELSLDIEVPVSAKIPSQNGEEPLAKARRIRGENAVENQGKKEAYMLACRAYFREHRPLPMVPNDEAKVAWKEHQKLQDQLKSLNVESARAKDDAVKLADIEKRRDALKGKLIEKRQEIDDIRAAAATHEQREKAALRIPSPRDFGLKSAEF